MLSHPSGTSRLPCSSEPPLASPGPCCQGKQSQQDHPQPPLSCHLLLAVRAQISNQDLIHLIRAVLIPDPAQLPPALHPPPTLGNLICTTLISRTANFSIWPLLTQGAQVTLVSVLPPSPPGCSRTPREADC